MATQISERTTTLADQRQALSALDRIIELHPNLPAVCVNLHPSLLRRLDVMAQSWPVLEAWREALNVESSEVMAGPCHRGRFQLEFSTEVDGVSVRVWHLGDLVQEQDVDETSSAVSA